MAKHAKSKKKGASAPLQRRELRFSTSAYLLNWVAIAGMIGSLGLGVGVFALWVIDPPLEWASYLVAAGGVGLGVALWFSQPTESAVTVGDAGIGVEDGPEMIRMPWHGLRSLKIVGGSMVMESDNQKVRFLIGANQKAVAWALKEAAERVPDIIDISGNEMQSLPSPTEEGGYDQHVDDDQVTGTPCAATKKIINMEEDARFCKNCGQVFHREGVPPRCSFCEADLREGVLRV